MGVIAGLVRFDREFFVVSPGSTVLLRFENNDLMPHNVVICRPGEETCMKVAEGAWALGDRAAALEYIPPDATDVLQHTRMLNPGESEALYFRAPEIEDDYPFTCTFPRHAYSMKGIMRVSVDLHQSAPEELSAEPIVLDPAKKPIVYRTTITGVSTSAIAVGMPKGPHYVFNPEQCTIALAWQGDFLDVSKDQMGRGGAGSKIRGEPFFRDSGESPLHLGAPSAKHAIQYRGYDLLDDMPVFHCEYDGVTVNLAAAPATGGTKLKLSHEVIAPKRDVFYVPPSGMDTHVANRGGGTRERGYIRFKAAPRIRTSFEIRP